MSTDANPVPLVDCITCHAWNIDQSLIAIVPNNNELHIYSTNNNINDISKWARKYVLSEHSGYISSIDWSHTTNTIVTCGHDRNSYVYKYDSINDRWLPELVILRINRACTYVKWSYDGTRFVVCSGSKQVGICYYEKDNNWWISKMIKKFKSTVLCAQFSRDNKLLITGSADNKCKIFNADINKNSTINELYNNTFIPQSSTFSDILYEWTTDGWVNSVDWSYDGKTIAYTTHSSTIVFVSLLSKESLDDTTNIINTNTLPYNNIVFTSNTQLIAAGYNMNIDLYEYNNNNKQWLFVRKIDTSDSSSILSQSVKNVANSAFNTARGLFGDVVSKGTLFGQKLQDSNIYTKHKNNIVNICLINDNKNNTNNNNNPIYNKFTTASLDGRIIQWDINIGLINKVTNAVEAVKL